MKETIKGYVYYVKYDFAPKPMLRWNASATLGEASAEWVLIGPHDFDVECPDSFDPRPQQIAAIDSAITKARAEFTARLNELQEQKNKLLCLEMAP
jgi:hypothetical protein